MTSTSIDQNITVLCQLFASYGLPLQLVSAMVHDLHQMNYYFMKPNGVKRIKYSPYHPSSNGLVERFA